MILGSNIIGIGTCELCLLKMRRADVFRFSVILISIVSVLQFCGYLHITTLPQVRGIIICSDFVIFSDGFRDGRGLGNQLFNFVSGDYISKLSSRRLAMNSSESQGTQIEQFFELKFDRVTGPCPGLTISDGRALGFNKQIENITRGNEIVNKTIHTSGFFQSWKYIWSDVEIHDSLQFKSDIKEFVNRYFTEIYPQIWNTSNFTRIGIHIRRGDIAAPDKLLFGCTLPNASYFHKAMQYMAAKFGRVQFVVVSNDYQWAKQNLNSTLVETENRNSSNLPNMMDVAFAKAGNSVGQDLAILSGCNHVIMSTGTFGWWGAWLANGTTIYYSNWPRNGSTLFSYFVRNDFFPPDWIGMDD